MKPLNIGLVMTLACGSLLYVQSSNELRKLQTEATRIAKSVGDFEVADPNLLYAQTIDSQDPWEWSWHFYWPANSVATLTPKAGTASNSIGFSTQAQHTIGCIAIRPTRDGAIGLYTRAIGLSSMRMGSQEFFEFLNTNRERLMVERLAGDGLTTLKPGSQPVTLLKIAMPDDLAREALSQFTDPHIRALVPVLFEAQIELK